MTLNVDNTVAGLPSVFNPAQHSLYECRNADDFRVRFERLTGCSIRSVADEYVASAVDKAVYLMGSIPLGMATGGSDIDLLIVTSGGSSHLRHTARDIVNSDQGFGFTNDANNLLVGTFVTLLNGVAVEVQVAAAIAINRVYARLKRRGPELSESEIITLGRLGRAWLLWDSDGFLERSGLTLHDPALDVYCSTKHFVSAEIYRRKAQSVLELHDIPLALHLGRLSVEMGYLAYFASEGFSYLGVKWLAQIGHAHSAAERVMRHPLLKEGLQLLFPALHSSESQASDFLQRAAEYLRVMRDLIEEKTLFRIAYYACPQIHDIPRRR